MRGGVLVLGLSAVVLVGVGVLTVHGAPAQVARSLCVTMIDVGQGDAQLVELPDRSFWLVDGGGFAGGNGTVGSRAVLPYLRRHGVVRIERLFITHGDSDHFEGLFALVGEVDVGELWLPTRRRSSVRLRRLVRQLEREGTVLQVVDEGARDAPAPAPARAQLLHPSGEWTESPGREAGRNDGSIVLRLALGEVSFLLTGDIESATEEWLVRSGVLEATDVLKIPHHGSRSSSTDGFVSALHPLLAVAGAGQDNRYGFPHASVRRRYLLAGTRLLWTGRHGSVRVCTDGWDLRAEGLSRQGRREELASWSPAELSTLRAARRHREHPTAVTVPSGARPPVRRAPDRSSRGPQDPAASSARRKSRKRGRSAEPSSPELIDEKTWQRRRKKRSRLRPGW